MSDLSELTPASVATSIVCRRLRVPLDTAGIQTLQQTNGSVVVTVPDHLPVRIAAREVRAATARMRVAALTGQPQAWRAVPDPNAPKTHVLLSSPTSDKLVRLSVTDAAALVVALCAIPTVQDAVTRPS